MKQENEPQDQNNLKVATAKTEPEPTIAKTEPESTTAEAEPEPTTRRMLLIQVLLSLAILPT